MEYCTLSSSVKAIRRHTQQGHCRSVISAKSIGLLYTYSTYTYNGLIYLHSLTLTAAFLVSFALFAELQRLLFVAYLQNIHFSFT